MISLSEFIPMLVLAVISDFLELAGSLFLLIPAVGIAFWLPAYIFGLIISTILGIWIYIIGAKMFWDISMSIADSITGGILPLRTIGIVLTYITSKRKKQIK